MKKDEIVKFLTECRDSLDSKDRDELHMLSGSIDSIITDYFSVSKTLRDDLLRIRTNVGHLVGTKSDTFIGAVTLDNQKILFKKYLDVLINQISKLGIPDAKKNVDKSINLNVSQNQNQTQTQKLVLEIFIESIKDEVTGKQLKELKTIVNEEKEPKKARTRILDKLNSFGVGVCTNILTNIISNPVVWAGLL